MHLFHYSHNIFRHAFFMKSTDAITLKNKTITFLANNPMQDMSAPITEQHHIQPSQFIRLARIEHHLIQPIPQQRLHGVAFHPKPHTSSCLYLRLHPGKETFIRNRFHLIPQKEFDMPVRLLPYRANKPNDKQEQPEGACPAFHRLHHTASHHRQKPEEWKGGVPQSSA